MKELIADIFGKLKEFAERIKTTEVKLEGVDVFIKDFTPFDPSELKKSLDDVKEEVNNLDLNITYDDSELLKTLKHLEERLAEKGYDDTLLKDMIADVKDSIPEVKEYDDTAIREEIENVTKSLLEGIKTVKEAIPEIPEVKEYDDKPLAKKLREELVKAILDVEGRVKKEIPEVKAYDDTKVIEMIADVIESIPEIPEVKAYDDAAIRKELEDSVAALVEDITATNNTVENVKESMPKAYDDRWIKDFKKAYDEELPQTVIKEIDDRIEKSKFDPKYLSESIIHVSDEVRIVRESIPKAYDDSDLKEVLEHFTKKYDSRLNTIEDRKGYDDSGLQESLNEIKTIFEKEVAAIKKEINTPLKVEIPTTKHYDGKVTPAGDMVLHDNNLYVNLLNANDSVPSMENKSYKLIIKAPKAPEHKGVYKADHEYTYNDIVMWDNASWIKTAEDNQELPSEGWKLLAKGIRGKKGEKGPVSVADYDSVIEELSGEVRILKATLKGFTDEVN